MKKENTLIHCTDIALGLSSISIINLTSHLHDNYVPCSCVLSVFFCSCSFLYLSVLLLTLERHTFACLSVLRSAETRNHLALHHHCPHQVLSCFLGQFLELLASCVKALASSPLRYCTPTSSPRDALALFLNISTNWILTTPSRLAADPPPAPSSVLVSSPWVLPLLSCLLAVQRPRLR